MKLTHAVFLAAAAGLVTTSSLLLRPRDAVGLPTPTAATSLITAGDTIANPPHAPHGDPIVHRQNSERSVESLRQQIESTLASISAEADQAQRDQLLLATLNAVPFAAIPSVLAGLQITPESDASLNLSQQLIRRWAQREPGAAAAWSEQLPKGKNRTNTLEQVTIAWAQSDLDASVRWACLLRDDGEWQHTVLSIASEAVRSTPKDALALARELPENIDRNDVIVRSVGEWAVVSSADAIAWAKQIDDATLRERALSAIAIASSDRDPVGAANLIVQSLSPGRQRDDAVISVVQRWAQTAPAQAAAWVERFPPGELRLTAIENLAALWSLNAAARPEQWLNRLKRVTMPFREGLPAPSSN